MGSIIEEAERAQRLWGKQLESHSSIGGAVKNVGGVEDHGRNCRYLKTQEGAGRRAEWSREWWPQGRKGSRAARGQQQVDVA